MRHSAVLLTGGQSARMGRDKALITIDGEPLWQRQLRVLRQLEPAELFVSGGSRQAWGTPEIQVIADVCLGCGPLGGLLAVLRRCATPALVVLAVDLPRITSNILGRLLDGRSKGKGAMFAHRGRFESLAAVYPVESLPFVEEAFREGNYSLQHIAETLVREGFMVPHTVADGEGTQFFNLNTPSDLAEAEGVFRV